MRAFVYVCETGDRKSKHKPLCVTACVYMHVEYVIEYFSLF